MGEKTPVLKSGYDFNKSTKQSKEMGKQRWTSWLC